MIKYHVVSYNYLRHSRKVFENEDEILPFLTALTKRCQDEERKKRLASLQSKLDDQRIDQKEYDYQSGRITEWKGFTHEDLSTSIRILSFDQSVWEGLKVLTE